MKLDAFRDDDQRHRVCRTLLGLAELEHHWRPGGFTAQGRALAEAGALSLPADERAFFLVAWSIASGRSCNASRGDHALTLDDLGDVADPEPIYQLLTATLYGPRAIDVWLTRPTHGQGFVSADDEKGLHAQIAQLFDEARAIFAEHGEEALNVRASADACALGAQRMADYVLMRGAREIVDDETRWREATQLTVRMLTTMATIYHGRAEGRAEEA